MDTGNVGHNIQTEEKQNKSSTQKTLQRNWQQIPHKK